MAGYSDSNNFNWPAVYNYNEYEYHDSHESINTTSSSFGGNASAGVSKPVKPKNEAKIKKTNMVWTERHDVMCAIEILVRKPYAEKKGTVAAGQAWQDIANVLNKASTEELYIRVDKRAVSDHYRDVMLKKWNEKNRKEENATGGGDVENSEFFTLMQDIEDDKEKSLLQPSGASCSKEVDKAKGEEVRAVALEKMGETKKRQGEENELTSPGRKNRRSAFDGLNYLQERNSMMREMEEKKLELEKETLVVRKKEAENVAACDKMMMEEMKQQQQHQQQQLEMMMKFQTDMLKMMMEKKQQ